MKKRKFTLTIKQAVQKAEGDLRLENGLVSEWGNGIFGAEAAARYYFKTSAAGLSAAQAAKLAAMVPNPRYYDKHRSDPRLLRKAGIILRRMPFADAP